MKRASWARAQRGPSRVREVGGALDEIEQGLELEAGVTDTLLRIVNAIGGASPHPGRGG